MEVGIFGGDVTLGLGVVVGLSVVGLGLGVVVLGIVTGLVGCFVVGRRVVGDRGGSDPDAIMNGSICVESC